MLNSRASVILLGWLVVEQYSLGQLAIWPVLIGEPLTVSGGNAPKHLSADAGVNVDENGYIFYCPCHGRFGNQADQFLGSLAFAKRLNRTLILPPWRTYNGQEKMLPFAEIFRVKPLKSYHRVLTAEDFMTDLSKRVWPLSKRIAFCYGSDPGKKPCTTDSEFFAEFWRFVGVSDFSHTVDIRGLHYEESGGDEWKERFPAEEYPVIALRGPPAPFPVSLRHWPLQKYLVWSESVADTGEEHLQSFFAKEPFLGVHLRNGGDWIKACDLLRENRHELRNLMASSQCLGENPDAPVTEMMCLPTKEEIIRSVLEALDEFGMRNLYVATDHDPHVSDLRSAFPSVNVVHFNPPVAQIDLYILGKSTVFIGNCVSSFSSFVRREREISRKPSTYFGLQGKSGKYYALENSDKIKHSEL